VAVFDSPTNTSKSLPANQLILIERKCIRTDDVSATAASKSDRSIGLGFGDFTGSGAGAII